MTKKDKILKATMEEVKTLKHEIDMSRQVKTNKESLVNKKEKELKSASRTLKRNLKHLKNRTKLI